METDTRQLVLGLEVIPIAASNVEKNLDCGVAGKDSCLDNKGSYLPVDCQLARDIQWTSRLEQLLGQGLVPGKWPKAYVDGREVLGLKDYKTLRALQWVSVAGAATAATGLTATANGLPGGLRLSQEESQLSIRQFEVGGKVDIRWRGTGRRC